MLTPDRRALILKYEPVARAVAARAFDRVKGRCARLGLEGQDLLRHLQQEALCALAEAAQRFDPTRLGQDSGKPVTFAPFARSTAKWAVHYALKGGRRQDPWTDDLSDHLDIAEEAPELDAVDRARVGERLQALSPRLQRAAMLWAQGEDDRGVGAALGLTAEQVEGLRGELRMRLADLAPDAPLPVQIPLPGAQAQPMQQRPRAQRKAPQGRPRRQAEGQLSFTLEPSQGAQQGQLRLVA